MRCAASIAVLMLLASLLESALRPARAAGPMRFGTVAVYVESGTSPLAAWQLDVAAAAPGSGVKIVGIEGGEHRVFANPPYYDTRAMEHERVIIAAFSTAAAENLPSGRTRVATIHYVADGDGEPAWRAEVTASATTGGAEIPASVSLETGTP